MAKAIGLGGVIFLVGLILAVIISIFSSGTAAPWAVFLLAVIGLIVGLFNVTESETLLFLAASIAFLISFQALGNIATTIALGWESVSVFFQLLNVFVAPAAAVVALKALFKLAKD